MAAAAGAGGSLTGALFTAAAGAAQDIAAIAARETSVVSARWCKAQCILAELAPVITRARQESGAQRAARCALLAVKK